MSEAVWLRSDNPKEMLGLLTEASDRKFRLFSCASCRRIWRFLTDERSRDAVEVAERYADGVANEEEREQAQSAAAHVRQLSGIAAKWTAVAAARTGATMTIDVAGQTAASPPGQEYDPRKWYEEGVYQCDLLRHIFGNPFRPYPAPGHWPKTVVQLAEALYNGQDCGFALHDALLEAGHPNLAEHFRQEKEHPKGCWVVDLLLGKK
jgi:hypothetical protein